MTHFDPIYGELLTSREVADITGFTLNQLRNQRQRPETSPLNYIRQGGTSWYRKDDIDLWLEANGGVKYEYVKSSSAPSAPLRGNVNDVEHRSNLVDLGKINSSNAFSTWYTWFIEQSGWSKSDPYDQVKQWQISLFGEATGEDLNALFPDMVAFNTMRKADPFRYWPSIVYAMRRAVCEVRGWQVSDAEIVSLPVGDVPPAKLV